MWLWIPLILVAILVAWFLLKVALTFMVPEKISGTLLFKSELKKLGIPYQHLPKDFFVECVAWANKVSSVTGRHSTIERKAEFVKTIETLAHMVALWRREPDSPMFRPHENSRSTYSALFEKYELR